MYHMYIKGFVNGRFQWSSFFFLLSSLLPKCPIISLPWRTQRKSLCTNYWISKLGENICSALVFEILAILFYPWHPACLRHPGILTIFQPSLLGLALAATLATLATQATFTFTHSCPPVPLNRDHTHVRRRRRGRRLVKMCFYLTLKCRIYLDLFSVFVGFNTSPCWICYECVHFQIAFQVAVLERTAKKCTKIYNARAQPLFCSYIETESSPL